MSKIVCDAIHLDCRWKDKQRPVVGRYIWGRYECACPCKYKCPYASVIQ